MKKYIVRVFDFALVFSMVLPYQFATAATQIPQPVSCWSFDETSGDAHDAVGTNTLVNQNNMPYATGNVGGAADIDDHNSLTDAQYLSIEDSTQQGLQMTDTLSASVWINYDVSMDNTYSMIFSKFNDDNYSVNDISYALAYNGADHQLQFWASRDGDTSADNHPSTAPVAVWTFTPTPGVWYHFVVTYKAGDVHLFIDSKEQNVVYNYTDTSIHQSTAPFAVGYTSVIREQHAKIDELGIWNVELSKQQAKALYNKGTGVSCTSL